MVKMMEVEISDGDGDTLKEAARKVKVSNKILDCKLQVDKDFFLQIKNIPTHAHCP